MINLVISNLLINPNNSLVYTRNGVNMQAKCLLSSPPELTSASDNKLTIHTIIRSHADNTLSISYVEIIPFFAKKE